MYIKHMQIVLERGKQKELITNAKNNSGLPWKLLGRKLKVNPKYLSGDIKFENVKINENLYKKLCKLSGSNFDHFIVSRLPINWGQVKGGRLAIRRPHPLNLIIQNPSVELAEITGVILGDGSIYKNWKHGINQLVITGHIKNDYSYLTKFVKPILEKLFSRKFHLKKYEKKNAIRVYNQEKDVIFTLESFGLKTGNKTKNGALIPDWIFSSEKFLKACIRGLIDTDGSVYPITGRKYTYIQFSSASPELRNSFDKAMKILGFKTSKWSKNGTPEIFIGNKKDIEKYGREIGFNNPYHKNRFKAPVVQSGQRSTDAYQKHALFTNR